MRDRNSTNHRQARPPKEPEGTPSVERPTTDAAADDITPSIPAIAVGNIRSTTPPRVRRSPQSRAPTAVLAAAEAENTAGPSAPVPFSKPPTMPSRATSPVDKHRAAASLKRRNPHVRGGSPSGASRARTGDLLHAMQAAVHLEFGLFAGHFGLRRSGLRRRCCTQFPQCFRSDRAKGRGLWPDPPSSHGHGRGGHSRAAARPACDPEPRSPHAPPWPNGGPRRGTRSLRHDDIASASRSPTRATSDAIRRLASSSSGCHWTPSANVRDGSSIASTSPSPARPLTRKFGPTRSTA